MIIVSLKGGLGNQMFQYACGKALAIKNNDVLKLDISAFINQHPDETPRSFALNCFTITAPLASATEMTHVKKYLGSQFLFNTISYINKKIYRRFYPDYHPEIMNSRGNVFLDGFFNSELYFKDIRQVILTEFQLKYPWSQSATEARTEILQQSTLSKNNQISISLHVRRGDYVSNLKANSWHGVCSIDYYKKAIEYIAHETKKTPTLFVFSDDIPWVKENLMTPYTTVYVIKKDDMTDHEEMHLMSICDHHIIANSTYSWWGAWLDQKKTIVVAPKKWTLVEPTPHKHILPSSWIPL